ncbi:hypothetical protein Dalk_0755 [Desulfatibacillum aliphaticivorans]|uniref:Uncharacterized protein n=1 Tax=Desulfatibacillum aliphaticivorans TaxID=218208 RepID=B8FHP3_DESAL|nr:DUF2284 domain-containing protein [Desulfatibacillum aliphaticivorans]ACL02460.1 hypothetical protein Dalk_0755 [Desulfatibacillum aliphaticivorans]
MPPNTDPHHYSKAPKQKDPALIAQDMEELLKLALDRGAREVRLTSGRALVFDESLARVDPALEDPDNLTEHWPVRMPLDSLWDSFRSFKYGVFFCCLAPLGMPDQGQGWIEDVYYRQACLQAASIITALESDAFNRGYHMTSGFGAGNCRSVLCHKESRCQALVRAKGCIHPYKARPTLAAVGIDAKAMARNLDVPLVPDRVNLYGLVMVG